MSINCLVFSRPADWHDQLTFDGDWVEFPSFHKLIWPFLLDNTGSISGLYLFDHAASMLHEDDPIRFAVVKSHGKFGELGVFSNLSARQRDQVSESSYKPRFSIFYGTSDWDFLVSFVKLFPFPSIIEQLDENIFYASDLPDLSDFVGELEPNACLFAFEHDADHVIMFGELEFLEKMQKTHAQYLRSGGS